MGNHPKTTLKTDVLQSQSAQGPMLYTLQVFLPMPSRQVATNTSFLGPMRGVRYRYNMDFEHSWLKFIFYVVLDDLESSNWNNHKKLVVWSSRPPKIQPITWGFHHCRFGSFFRGTESDLLHKLLGEIVHFHSPRCGQVDLRPKQKTPRTGKLIIKNLAFVNKNTEASDRLCQGFRTFLGTTMTICNKHPIKPQAISREGR